MTPLLIIGLLLGLACATTAAPMPTVQYTALSDAARKAGRLTRYEAVPTRKAALEMEGHTLTVEVPRAARAYDVVPVRYRLQQPAADRRCAVEAVAFEDARKADGRPLYDMAIPGDLGVRIEYLGSICADNIPGRYVPLTPDPKTPVSPYPHFRRDPMVRSGTIRQAQLVWFKFRVTNTGDTILDPEGFGASFASPVLHRLQADGSDEWIAQPINLFERHLGYLYPGQSWDCWVHFWCPKFGTEYNHGLKEGNYRVEFPMLYRYHREYSWGVNIWAGAPWCRLEMPITVAREASDTPVQATFKRIDDADKMPGYIDSFEEFMTAFRIHPPAAAGSSTEGVVYLQVAPWTRHATVKLILANPRRIAVARLPIQVSQETLAVKHNPDNVMAIDRDGKREPVIVAQAMPGMRTGVQLGPFPERHLRAEILEMKRLGVNVLANTAGGWWIGELTGSKYPEPLAAQYKYFYDVLARQAGIKLMGWSVYPPTGTHWTTTASALLGHKIDGFAQTAKGYAEAGAVDIADPIVPEVVAAWTRYQYQRWGDMWFRTLDGRVPVDVEDTWGWMRDDINVRYPMGPIALDRFRSWVEKRYGTVDKVNRAWGSSFAGIKEIDPQANQGVEGDGMSHGPVYNVTANPFHDWSPAVADWDLFRTELRMEFLKEANRRIREFLPGAELAIRTEGANLVVPGDPASESMHWRHVAFSQRRNAMVFDAVRKADQLHFYSDYTTLPYSEEEWREGMRGMVAAGVIPAFLPQFDHMRDILLNPHYGREYQVHYGLKGSQKGMMIHCLMAAYPWWKATYEEGGAPGILWSDYLCDGFATETQKREVKLLRRELDRMEAP